MVKKIRNVTHKNEIISENERIFISINSKEIKAMLKDDDFEYKIPYKNTLYKKVHRILFGSHTAEFEYYSIMKDYWKENPNMTKEEAEKLLSKIKKNIDLRVYNILKEIDSNGNSSTKRRMDYVHAMMDVEEREKEESKREYKENCIFKRNQALKRAKINIKYEIDSSIKSLPIILNALKAKKLAGSIIKVEKKESDKDERIIQKTRRFKPVNFRIEDLKSKVSNLQFGNKMKKMRFEVTLGVSAILGGVIGYNVVGPAIANNMANGFAVESDADTTSKDENEHIFEEDSELTINDIDKLINRNIGNDKNTMQQEDNVEQLEQTEQKDDGKLQEEIKEQSDQNGKIEELAKQQAQSDEADKQEVNEAESINLRDILMEILNIGFDSEIHNLQGKCSDSPEKKGDVEYKSGAKKVGIVDIITNDGYTVFRPEDTNMNFSEIKKSYPDAIISYHVISAKGNGVSGWNLSTENNIEDKMVKTALHKIKPYIIDDTEVMQFLCENDINSNIDASKYKDELEKIKQAVEQYEKNKQVASHNGQSQGEGR